jgi:catechol 2,3-dioxygenase-like lactoylglutathione lyase family enzyme
MPIPIQSVMHVNLNCSDLERSLAFYTEALGLVPAAHTNPLPQAGFPMGAAGRQPDSVQWDAWILQDSRGFAGPGLDLLQWKLPEPVGTPYPVANHLGLTRIGVAVPDLDTAHRRIAELGHRCLSAPTDVPVGNGGAARICVALDPDGAMVELVAISTVPAPQLLFAEIGCSELERSLEWYERVLGLEVHGRCAPGPQPGIAQGIPGDVEWEVAYLRVPGRDDFGLDLMQWQRPAPLAPPYPCANHRGLYRIAFLVADIRECVERLSSAGVACPAPVFLDMGPEIPIDGVWALFFPDPDGTCIELIESPKLA